MPAALADRAYDDEALPIDDGQSISQPYVVAWMTELLDVEHGTAVLEIGTGTGYQAAVLAAMGAQVRTIERIPALAEAARERLARLGWGGSVEVIVADGSLGDPATAPHDRILVTAGAPTLPGPVARPARRGRPAGDPDRGERRPADGRGHPRGRPARRDTGRPGRIRAA